MNKPLESASPNNGAAGLLNRLTQAWKGRFASAEAKPDDDGSGPAVDPRLALCAEKICSAPMAVAQIKPGDHVFVGTACATPRALVAALEALSPAPQDVELLHFLTDQAVQQGANGQPQTKYQHRCFFVGQDLRSAVKLGLADYVPISIARVPQLIAIGRIPLDVALIQVSMPDEFGYVSLGVSVDIAPAAVAKARLVIAEVNPHMPRSMGDSTLHVGEIDWLVPVDTPVIEYTHPAQQTEVVEKIARYISSIIDDGSTLQIGMGRFSNEALKYLTDRQDLGIHSDVITDAIIPLLERGILTGQRKSNQRGKIVSSFAMGTRRLYDLIDRNPMFSFQPIEAVCDAWTLGSQHKLVSVTQAFAVDLTGQVCVDQYQGDFYSGVAAQAEFLQGASRSPGGKAIICLASTEEDGLSSRIRPALLAGEGVAIPRSDVHYVITEYGIAYLFGKSIRERAVAMIQIAHPSARPGLFEQAQALGYVSGEQSLRNLQAYAVEEERQLQLKDKRPVLLRPACPSDGEGIRSLFHQLPEHDIYTRFFRRLRGLSNRDVQRLCNLNSQTEVGLVACVGTRENPKIIAHAMYMVDPGTNLAETAFMVHPDWQGQGLGALLQQRMSEHAKARGVRGFVAEVLANNEHMIKLARSLADNVQVESLGSSVKITSLL
ncbi:bifunctional acetyl-CoA hydrolase/transferase family protein/GNAT family N-acetyltransferase [Roseateles albus]|uniref:GNAT family N-acetyltransferase n=1 Tax=Roseateles albus TaxID=2987525 RepID=A0ABT5KFG8_9BURK|nr:bifunctional acetyl-CoA hydrolase/transferase family protein/GNAT family N-acetyltransferase [Roseateles albus]MDC8772677.1 GNAT family N-acetyltransferase [Roseateles albus]